MITKFLPIATLAVLTALTIGGNGLCPAQAAKTKTPEAAAGTAAGAKPAAPAAAAKKPPPPGPSTTAPAPVAATAPVPAAAPSPAAPELTKVDANTPSKERGFTTHESQAPIMTDDQRNALYFQWIGGFVLITGAIIGLIIYKAMPPKPGASMSLEQAFDAYDGKKEGTADKASSAAAEIAPADEQNKPAAAAEIAPADEQDKPAAASEIALADEQDKPAAAESTAQKGETTESTEPAPAAPAEAASSDSESKAEEKNIPATG